MKVGIVRFGNVFDSFGSVSELFRHNILNNKKLVLVIQMLKDFL